MSRAGSDLDARAAGWTARGLALLLALVPLPAGAVAPWAEAALTLAVAGLCAAALLRPRPAAVPPPLAKWLWGVSAVAGLLLAWAGVQLVPWAVQLVGPPVGAELAAAAGHTPAIALNPDGALDGMLAVASVVAVFLLAAVLGSRAENARAILTTVALAGGGYAAYALGERLAGGQAVLLPDPDYFHSWVAGPFVNANHFAGYLGFGLVAAAGLAIDAAARTGQPVRRPADLLRALDRLGPVGWLCLAALPAIAVALLLTGSIGGVAGSALALASLVAIKLNGGPIRRQVAAILALALAGAGALALYGTPILGDVAGTLAGLEAAGRATVYGHAVELIADRPLTGYGLAGFADAFLQVRGGLLAERSSAFLHAHNDYLELAVELGVPMALLAVATLAALAVRCVVGAAVRRRASRRLYPGVGAAASVLVATHALVDFSLRTPAVAVTFAALLGIGLAQSFSRAPSAPARTAGPPVEGTAGEGGGGPAAEVRPVGQPVERPPA